PGICPKIVEGRVLLSFSESAKRCSEFRNCPCLDSGPEQIWVVTWFESSSEMRKHWPKTVRQSALRISDVATILCAMPSKGSGRGRGAPLRSRNCKIPTRVHLNLQSEAILVSEDRLRIALSRFQKPGSSWLTPFGIALTLLA